MEWLKDDYKITTDKNEIDIDYVYGFLSTSYWAANIPLELLKRSINGSICFSVFHLKRQIGFARVITDSATFAYLADVFIDETYRGIGLSKWLIQIIVDYPAFQGLRRFMLATRDAHGLYKQFGFKPLSDTERFMHKHNTIPYGTPSPLKSEN